jgi:hypothetical protein
MYIREHPVCLSCSDLLDAGETPDKKPEQPPGDDKTKAVGI